MKIYPYAISYYRSFWSSIICSYGEYWVKIGTHPIILLMIPTFIKNRKDKDKFPIFILFICLLAPLLISKIGTIFDGFSYPNNRWSFVLSFLFSYITVMFINSDKEFDKKELKYIGIFVVGELFLTYILRKSIIILMQINLIVCLCTFLIILNKNNLEKKFKKVNLYNISLTAIMVIGILYMIYYFYDVEQKKYVAEFIGFNKVDETYSTAKNEIDDFGNAVDFIKEKDNTFYKIGKGKSDIANVAIIKDYNSITHYYSIITSKLSEIATDLENAQKSINREIKEFDYRTKITTLLGNKYFIEPNLVPYGYKEIKNYESGTTIYENEYCLPFAVLYTDYIKKDEFQSLKPNEKESSLLKTVALDDEIINKNKDLKHNDNVVNYIKENSVKEVDYEIKENKLLKDNKVTVKKASKNQIVLNIGEVQNSELYVSIENLKYEPYSKQQLIKMNSKSKGLVKKQEVKNKYRWYQKEYDFKITATMNAISRSESTEDCITSPYYFDNYEYLINLGYHDKTSGDITLTFSKIGTYSFDSIKILAVPMDDYEKDINNLRRSNFEVTEYGNGYLKGTVNAEKSGILQFSTVYQKGWEVYVDGNKVDNFEVNKYFLGINIQEGKHSIYLKYTTPYVKEGVIISVIGILAFVGIIAFERKKQKNNSKV